MKILRKPYAKSFARAAKFSRMKNTHTSQAPRLSHLSNLQHTIGNRAFGQLIQTKLKIGQPEDRFEREADHVADTIMRMPEPPLQRQPEEGDLRRQPEEDEEGL